MPTFTSLFMQYLNPRKTYIWMFLLVAILAYVAYYVYKNHFQKLANKKALSDIPNSGSGEHIQIMMFTVDWCPHCKNAKTPWNDFKTGYNNKKIEGKLVTCIEYNMTEKKSDEPGYSDYINAKSAGEQYGVDSFPTIKMKRGDQVIDFDAKITTYSLEQFLENMM